MSRDVCAEMAGLIEKATEGGSYSPPVLAAEIVEDLREKDPELLAGWLDAQAVQIVRHTINQFDHSRRSHATATRQRGRFAAAAEAHSAGDSSGLTPFLDMPFTVSDGSRLQLRTMTGPDCGFVAESYENRAAQNSMWAAFFRAMEKKCKGRAVADVYTEDQLAAMFSGLQPAA